MIRSYFGISNNPFAMDNISLLPHQQDVYDILKVHCQQGGLCLLMGDPGTGKSVIKEAVKQNADKRMVVVTIARTLHTYTNTIKILCQAFNIEWHGAHFKCEKRLIEEAFALYREGKTLIMIIDDAHLMEIDTLRKIRLLTEDFPKNHNLILAGQPELLYQFSLKVNHDIKSRITYSTTLRKLNPDDMKMFIFSQIDKIGLGHNTFSEEAIDLIVRSADGILRKAKNLCIGCMLEAVRRQNKIIDLDNVNKVLIQPHWRVQFETEQLLGVES
ncbi:MAG: AAA family ATPase [Desulfobacteraceae bacterium]|jgi:type II secretory pathway predicted ATPase ExeA